MWAKTLRPLRSRVHRTVRFSRGYNGQHQGPHTTYFQPPPKPPRRIFRSILLGTTFFGLGAYAHSWLIDEPFFGIDILPGFTTEEGEQVEGDELVIAMAAAAQDTAARQVPVMDLPRAQEFLELRAGFSVTPKAVSHTCQLPSNLPCEDTTHAGVYNLFKDAAKDWATWSIFDGHAGPRTAQVLKEFLPVNVGGHLWEMNLMDRSYVPNDYQIIQTIKRAFRDVDNDILSKARERVQSGEGDLAHTVMINAPAISGSCALMALYDPARSILRVANTGDSRAVLGRWDGASSKYVAQPMSVDQTGFNQNEVERLKREHPDEDSIDPNTGRVHGIAISRAFGDSRWKWANELTQTVHEKFWGPSPRPNGVIKTPPYLTAEPEIMETKVQSGEHPDFLIMASDGLWDNMSSEDAVTCVQQWLDKYKPTNFLEQTSVTSSFADLFRKKHKSKKFPDPPESYDPTTDEETYYDENERAMKWRVSPKHFVVEDEHCGVHLVKNALGGSRRNLFCGIMSIQPPLSRNVRDDITVHVIFFGVDTTGQVKQ